MVANAGAGPKPIPQKQLTVERLVEAIKFVTSPMARDAADRLAQKMRQETGVDTAVASFHRMLPRDNMRCEIVAGQIARWALEKHGKRFRISDSAVAVLVAQKKIRMDQLRP